MTTTYELPDHEYRTLWHKACQDLERLQSELDNIKEVEFPRRVEYVTEGWRAKCERLQAELGPLVEALQYAVKQVPELADVPGIKKQLEKHNGH